MKKRVIALAMSCIMTVANINLPEQLSCGNEVVLAAETESLGDYTFSKLGDNTYAISTSEDLINLSSYVNAGNNCKNITFKMTNNIDMSGVSDFEPIGHGSNYEKFSGTFDGCGYTIKNLDVVTNKTRANGAGLFGYLSEGTVSNITFDDCDMEEIGTNYAGVVAAYTYSARITNCHVKSNCSAIFNGSTSSAQGYSGGITGYARFSYVNNNSSEATVTSVKENRSAGVIGYCNINYEMNNNYYYGDLSFAIGDVNTCNNNIVAASKYKNSDYGVNKGYTFVAGNGFDLNDFVLSDFSGNTAVSPNGKAYFKSGDKAVLTISYSKGDGKLYDIMLAGHSSVSVQNDGKFAVTFGDKDVTLTAEELKNVELSDASVSVNAAIYSGKLAEPVIKYNGNELVLNRDYTLQYLDGGINVGSATVKIIGKGSYVGSVTKTFQINKAPITITADDKEMLSSQSRPELTYTVTGLVNNETEEQAFTTKPSVSCEVDSYVKSGEHDILVGGAISSNYEINYDPGVLKVWFNYNKQTGKYEIGNANDLDELAQYVNSGKSTTYMSFIMTADILNRGNHTPIGYDRYFEGEFDGANHTISGMVIEKNNLFDEVGLFGNICYRGCVKNVNLVDFDIETKTGSTGGIVGYITSNEQRPVVISNCKVSGSITVEGMSTEFIGGIAGIVQSDMVGITISDCFADVEIIKPADNWYSSFGAIIGDDSDGEEFPVTCVYNNYYTSACKYNGIASGNVEGQAEKVYKIQTDGKLKITGTNGLVFLDEYYGKKGETIIAKADEQKGYSVSSVKLNGNEIQKNSNDEYVFIIGEEDVILTTTFTINKYTIAFNTDGGTQIASITKDYDSVLTKPENPLKDGYIFVGWDAEFPDKMPAQNMTLTAIWKKCINSVEIPKVDIPVPENSFVVNLDVASEGIEYATVTWKKGDEVVTGAAEWKTTYKAYINLKPKAGYVFINDNGNATTLIFNGNNVNDITENEDGSITFYCGEFTTATRKIVSIDDLEVPEQFEEYYTVDNVLDSSELVEKVTVTLEGNTLPNKLDMEVCWSVVDKEGNPVNYNSEIMATNIFKWVVKESEYIDKYAKGNVALEGMIEIKNKGYLPVLIEGKDVSMIYSGEDIDISKYFTIDENAGEASFELINSSTGVGELNGTILKVTQSGKFVIKVTTSINGTYGKGEHSIIIEVKGAVPNVVELPTVKDRVYDSTSTLASSEILGGIVKGMYGEEIKGVWSWKNANIIPTVQQKEYVAVFTPENTKLYQYVEIKLGVNVKKSDVTPNKPEVDIKPDKDETKLTKGSVIKKGNAIYKITKADKKNGTVTYVKPKNKKVKKIVVPDKIVVKGVTYKVTSIETKAFYKNKNIKTVVIGKNVNKIKKLAFYGCKNIKTITFKSTKLKKSNIGKKAFAKMSKNVTVKVPKKKVKLYKSIFAARGMNKKVKFCVSDV